MGVMGGRGGLTLKPTCPFPPPTTHAHQVTLHAHPSLCLTRPHLFPHLLNTHLPHFLFVTAARHQPSTLNPVCDTVFRHHNPQGSHRARTSQLIKRGH